MTEYLIGTGGWSYFQIPRLHPLVAYSRAFNFVEVNSTFYEIPPLKQVEKWRRIVPEDFQFTVRAHRLITHKNRLQPTKEALETFEKILRICNVLNAPIVHLQTPRSLRMDKTSIESLQNLLSTSNLGRLRVALEVRGTQSSKIPSELIKAMQEHNVIHCVDLSKGETPAIKSDITYSRLFGRGRHNIYQPTDQELKEIDEKTRAGDSKKVILSFHFIRMYKDAARFKTYKQAGKFPPVTRSTGVSSLEEVLKEDTQFPATKQELVHSQGWKLFDITSERRNRAVDLLQKLPEQTYRDVDEVVQKLQSIVR